jgi:putative Ca2+/H+ antiporter (TMEM165/GDT1 family)
LLLVVGLSFFAFAAWGLKGDTMDQRAGKAATSPLGALTLVTSAFFVSELGDKTQLATVSLAGDQESFVGVWLGSTLGMVAADALAILAGVIAGRRVPERTAALIAAALFVLFGSLALLRAAQLALS